MKKKRIFYFKILVICCLCISCFSVNAQNNPVQPDTASMPMGDESARNYAPVYAYHFNPWFPIAKELTLVDTLIHGIQRTEPLSASRHFYATLGVVGQANNSMDYYFKRRHGFVYKTMPYTEYHRRFENWEWHYTPESYTRVDYEWASGKENLFNVVHAQTVNNLELEIDFRTIIAEGLYVRQGVRDVNVGARMSYHIPSDIYGFTFAYIYNLFRLNENGGIKIDSLFEKGKEPRSIPVNLAESSSDYQDHDIFFRQYVHLFKPAEDSTKKDRSFGFIVHNLDFTRLKNLYKENNLNLSNYPVINYDSLTTFDSVTSYQFKNSLMWSNFLGKDSMQSTSYFLHMSLGMSHNLIKVGDSSKIFKENQFTTFGNMHLRLFKRLNLKADLLFTLNGYNANDISTTAGISWNFNKDSMPLHSLGFQASLYRYEPDYFYTYYFANTYNWNIPNLKKQQHVSFGLTWKYDNYTASLYYYTLKNAMTIGQNMQPMQLSKAANIMQFALWVPFRYKDFGFDVNAYVQYCDNEFLPMPWLATRESVFYGFWMFKKALFLQLGVEMFYNAPYYANGYNPVMQQFYYQKEKKTGDYYYLNFFANVKISRFYFHFVLGNFLADVFPRNYYFTPHYPEKGLHFKVGASWRFHD